MQLWLIRHAIAEDPSSTVQDADRRLTREGRVRFKKVVRWLSRHDVHFDALLHSPWQRACETAALLADLASAEARPCAALLGSPSDELLQELRGECVALVGHAPWLNETLSLLISGRTDLATRFDFKKGGVALLEGEPRPGRMTLLSLIPPRYC